MLSEPLVSEPLSSENQSPAVVRQRYEQIAERLCDDVRAGRLAPGERLPGERELAQRLGVGRASLREALGFLQVKGVTETRRSSGSYVALDAQALLAREASADVALPADASPRAVLQTRDLLEPQMARLAATGPLTKPQSEPKGSDPFGSGLEALLARMEEYSDPGEMVQRVVWSAADRDFHLRIAQLTGNPVLAAIGAHLAGLMDQPLWRQLRDDAISVPGRTTLQLAEHRLIAAAIAERDPDAAEHHARHHLARARRSMALDTE